MAGIIFITGTDTGVGKTVLTGLLLAHLRSAGCNALAVKPFCSGSRADVRLLRAVQEGALTEDEINPWFVKQPVAPAAAKPGLKKLLLDDVERHLRGIARRCDVLLVEGIGGLCVPLTENFTVLDLIIRLKSPVLVVSVNRLGTINHTLLTIKALQTNGVQDFKIIMMDSPRKDLSSASNVMIVEKMGGKKPVFAVPYMGKKADSPREIKINATFLKKTLARITRDDIFNIVLSGKRQKRLLAGKVDNRLRRI